MTSEIDQIAVMVAAAERVSKLVRSADLTTPVDHLGRWKVRDLVDHLSGVHRWATNILVTRSMDGGSSAQSKLDGSDLCDWFDEGVEQLTDALRSAGPDELCPNFNPGSEKTMAWWARRQMHETVVHAWDVEKAFEATTPFDPEVAVDGIDEFLDVFVRTRGKQTLVAPLVLTTTTPARSWTLTIANKPGRLDVAQGRSSDVATELTAGPEDLLLLLWGRHVFSEIESTVAGDPEIAASMFASS